jgi:hypothetical protein
MREHFTMRDYGRELFRQYTPAVVRPVADAFEVDLLSTSTFAQHQREIGAPLVEVSFCGGVLLDGVLRAARHADAPVTVALSALEPGGVRLHKEVRTVLECAADTGFDRPLALVARASSLSSFDDGEIDRVSERMLSVLDVGLTAFSFRPGDVALDRAIRLTRAVRPLLEWGVGVELEIDGTPADLLMLAELDEIGLPIAAVRGATGDDELCGGVLVVDPLRDALPEDMSAARVVLDGFLLRAARDVLGETEGHRLFARAADDTGAALSDASTLFDELPHRDRDRLEALVYGNVAQALVRLGAEHTSDRLLDALAREMYDDDDGARRHP